MAAISASGHPALRRTRTGYQQRIPHAKQNTKRRSFSVVPVQCLPAAVPKAPSVSPAAGSAGRRGARPPPKYLGPGSLPSYTDHLDLKTLYPGSRLMVLYAEYGGVGEGGGRGPVDDNERN